MLPSSCDSLSLERIEKSPVPYGFSEVHLSFQGAKKIPNCVLLSGVGFDM